MKSVGIGLVGLGTVGSGVVHILQTHTEDFKRRANVDMHLARVADRNLSRAQALGLEDIYTSDINELINDPAVDIVVELIGGTGAAKDVVLGAIAAGKQVVTANKALMATAGKEVLEAADAAGVEVAFEAAVGGGIPIISPLKHSLVSNEITSVVGIVNGTTNYMLTRMKEDGLDYDTALAEAQEMGFAEADPTADVDGLDAAAKIAILSSIAFNTRVVIDDVYTEGIRNLTPADLAYADEMGYAIKLLAMGVRTEKGIELRVHPTMIPVTHPLASISGVYNAIYVIGDAVGETMFFGEGAGSLPAASAVMGDVIEVSRRVSAGQPALVGCTCTDNLPLANIEDLVSGYYIRLVVADEPGVLAAVAQVFGECGVSIASVVQKSALTDAAEIVYVTHQAKEADVRAAIDRIAKLSVTDAIASIIRVEKLK